MDHLAYQSRRATPVDVPALQALWQKAELPWNELESFVEEFVVVPGPDGVLVGALGLMTEGHDALLHSEALMVQEDADQIREALWRRQLNLARAAGARRVWTQEDAPYWQAVGFAKVPPAALSESKASFLDQEAEWRSISLFDPEKAQEIIKEHMAVWETQRLEEANNFQSRTRRLTQVYWVVFAVMVTAGLIGLFVVLQNNPHFIQTVFRRLRGN